METTCKSQHVSRTALTSDGASSAQKFAELERDSLERSVRWEERREGARDRNQTAIRGGTSMETTCKSQHVSRTALTSDGASSAQKFAELERDSLERSVFRARL